MENPNISHQNSDSFSKKKLSLTSPVYKDFDFGQPSNSNKTSNRNRNNDNFGGSSGYPYNEMQFQLNYMPNYHNYYPHPSKTFVNHQDNNNPHDIRNEKSNEKPQQTNQNNPKNKDKKKENNKQGAQPPDQKKQNTTKNEQSQAQVQPQVASSDPAKKKKKKNKKDKQKEKEDFSDNPWAQPLKKALKKAAAVGPVSISNTKGNFIQKNKPEIKKSIQEEEKKTDEKEKVMEIKRNHEVNIYQKKFKFLRVRDIRSKFYANKPNKPIDRVLKNKIIRIYLQQVSQLRAKNIIDLNNKKKKLSKVKKAQLRYFELQVLNAKRAQKQENLKNKKEEAEDGYETVDEDDEEKTLIKEKKKNKKKLDKHEEKSSGGEEEEEKKEGFEDRKIDLSEYIRAIPELEIPDEKRPQTTYKNLKVRKWVDNILCEELDKMTFDLLNDLLRMQTIKKLIKPSKSKKRIYCGMREVLRSIITPLTDQVARCIVIAVNIQENPLQQGGDEKMLEIIMKARVRGIPIIHACSRKQLGQACTGNDYARISVVSVANYFGADELYKDLLQLAEEKKKEFQEKLNPNQ